jgi:hypothetical protein
MSDPFDDERSDEPDDETVCDMHKLLTPCPSCRDEAADRAYDRRRELRDSPESLIVRDGHGYQNRAVGGHPRTGE